MCAQKRTKLFGLSFSANTLILLGVVLGLTCGYFGHPVLDFGAKYISEAVLNMLRFLSVPLIFLSIVTTLSNMDSLNEAGSLGLKILRYTLSTTFIAATVGLCLYWIIDPAQVAIQVIDAVAPTQPMHETYMGALMRMFPKNLVGLFLENNVLGAVSFGLLFGASLLALPKPTKEPVTKLLTGLFQGFLKMTQTILKLMPVAVWAFSYLFITQLKTGDSSTFKQIGLYIACIVGANLIQGIVVLPTLLKANGISPIKLFRDMAPCLSVAFFTRSSAAALPVTMDNAISRAGITAKTARFSFPLCATINMNGCAAFILITVLFISQSQGVTFTLLETFLWVVLATVAAVGNAGVPMGCYFLASAFLASLGVSLELLAIILPIYTLLDMLETALNVWSDASITAVVDKKDLRTMLSEQVSG